MTFASLEERHDAITRLCCGRELDPDLIEKLGGAKRWKTYRHMVRTRLTNMIESGLPRTLGQLGKNTTQKLVADWFADGGLTSAYIRDAVPSFHAAVNWETLSHEGAPWLSDLARYETSLWHLRHAEASEQAVVDFGFEAHPVINPATEVMHLAYPVYRRDQTHFERDPKHVLLFRHLLTDKVGYLTLTDFQRTFFQYCGQGELPMTACVQLAAKEHDLPIDEPLLETVSSFLAELMSRTILIGSRPPTK